MQQHNVNTGNRNKGFFIGGTILTIFFFRGIYTFFEATAIAAKSLAAGLAVLFYYWFY